MRLEFMVQGWLRLRETDIRVYCQESRKGIYIDIVKNSFQANCIAD